MDGLLNKINWVDVLFLICFLRICLVSAKNGLPTEFFKLLGTVVATYISFHYFKAGAAFLEKALSLNVKDPLAVTVADVFSFTVLIVFSYLAVIFLRSLFVRLIQLEAHPAFDKWSALTLGVFRAVLFFSLFLSWLVLTDVGYFQKSIDNSFSGKRIYQAAPGTHNFIWNHLLSKF